MDISIDIKQVFDRSKKIFLYSHFYDKCISVLIIIEARHKISFDDRMLKSKQSPQVIKAMNLEVDKRVNHKLWHKEEHKRIAFFHEGALATKIALVYLKIHGRRTA